MLRYCLCFFLFAASLTSHAAVRSVIVQPGELVPTYGPGVGGDAFVDGRDWNATISDQKGSRHTVPVTLEKKYSWPTFRGALKNALKVNPGQLALTGVVAGALAGVDYIFENSQLQKKEVAPGDYVPAGNQFYWRFINSPTGNFPSPQAACATIQYNDIYLVQSSPERYACMSYNWGFMGSVQRYGTECPASFTYDSRLGTCVSLLLLPVSDSDLDSFVTGLSDPSFAASAASEILDAVPGSFDYPDSETFGGPNSVELPSVETTTLDQVTGDLTVVQETTTLDMVYGTNPLSITTNATTVTNAYQNGTLINTSTTTSTGPTVDAQPLPEVPTDCEFMPTVCAFLDWFKTPVAMPDPDLSPPVDADFERAYNGSFGGSCPAPTPIALLNFNSVEFSWSPICTFAEYMRFFVVAGSYLFAAFIGLGISRGNA